MAKDKMSVFMFGIPMPVGGANMERGDTALLWAKEGIKVTVLYLTKCKCHNPFPQPSPDNPWMDRLTKAGVKFVASESGKLSQVRGLRNGIVVDFCSPHIGCAWPELKRLGVKLVHSPCMTFTAPYEAEAFRQSPPSVIHYQSEYQREAIGSDWLRWGVKTHRVIPGAFDENLFPFKPAERRAGEAFVVGRLARGHRSKWSPRLWDIVGQVRKSVDVRMLCQSWTADLTMMCGPPPEWATCMGEGTLTSQDFLSRCHAMICPNWSVQENWPRVGLEALSTGVPIVADFSGGWPEMVENGVSGFLCRDYLEYGKCLSRLGTDEGFRQEVIEKGRQRLMALCQSDTGRMWREVFMGLQSSEGVKE